MPFWFSLMVCPRSSTGVWQWSIEKRHQGCQHLVRTLKNHEVIATRENSELRVWDDPIHLHRVLGTHTFPIAYHYQYLCFDLLEFLIRVTSERRAHLFDLLHENGPMRRVRRGFVVGILELGWSKVRRKALILPIKFRLVCILRRPGGRTKDGHFARKFRVSDCNSEGDCTSHAVAKKIRRFDLRLF